MDTDPEHSVFYSLSNVTDCVCLRETSALFIVSCAMLGKVAPDAFDGCRLACPSLEAKLGAPGDLNPVVLRKSIPSKEGHPQCWDEVVSGALQILGPVPTPVTCVTVDRQFCHPLLNMFVKG